LFDIHFFLSFYGSANLTLLLKSGPEPFKRIILKVFSPIGLHFSLIPVPKQIRPYHPTKKQEGPEGSSGVFPAL